MIILFKLQNRIEEAALLFILSYYLLNKLGLTVFVYRSLIPVNDINTGSGIGAIVNWYSGLISSIYTNSDRCRFRTKGWRSERHRVVAIDSCW